MVLACIACTKQRQYNHLAAMTCSNILAKGMTNFFMFIFLPRYLTAAASTINYQMMEQKSAGISCTEQVGIPYLPLSGSFPDHK